MSNATRERCILSDEACLRDVCRTWWGIDLGLELGLGLSAGLELGLRSGLGSELG